MCDMQACGWVPEFQRKQLQPFPPTG